MHSIRIPKRISGNWVIKKENFFESSCKCDPSKRIFKFCYQPETGELLFDIAPTHHKIMILNYGRKQFNDYVRGICFWDKKIIYLRMHKNGGWLKATERMLRKCGVAKNISITWGEKAAEELKEELRGL